MVFPKTEKQVTEKHLTEKQVPSNKSLNLFKIKIFFIIILTSILSYATYELISVRIDYSEKISVSSRPPETNLTTEFIETSEFVFKNATWIESREFLFRNATWKYYVGRWLNSCHESSPYIAIQEKAYGNKCPKDCYNNGVCNYETGECRCRMGYKGSDCTDLEVYACNLPPIENYPLGPWVNSLCAGVCDERTGKCKCGYDSKYPDRYVREICGFDGGPMYTGVINPDLLYSKNESKIGWCNADFNPMMSFDHLKYCICNQDGRSGRFCEIKILAYCLNGCAGHGVCESGYCQCKDGWHGIDCSIPSMVSLKGIILPPWLKERKSYANEKDKYYKTIERKRKRPLIYVYELPGKYNFQLLEGRINGRYCAPWLYGLYNETIFIGSLYAMEMAVYEAMLSSQHRTMNADLADYFFVPVLGACVIPNFSSSPNYGYKPKYRGYRQHLAADYYLEAYEHIKENYHYWNRSEGKDHIWVFAWDEGSCIAPQKIWNSIMITSFGNTMTHHPNSTTAYIPDSWNPLPLELRGDHPCYDPAKDIILPPFKDPNFKIVNLRLWEKGFEDRNTLFYFNGNLGFNYSGRPEPRYSMGIRQKVAYYFGSNPNIHKEYGIKKQKNVIVKSERAPLYAEELASSRFCGAFPGDGFSARMEDAILSGCIPVIIQDGIHMAFENFLNFDNFTVRINESDIPNMIQILEGISESRVKSMLQVIQGLWQRYTYHSAIKLEAKRQLDQFGNEHEWAKAYNQLQGDDALDTMFQILHYKLYNDPWRKEERNVSQSEIIEQPNPQHSANCF